RTKFMCARYERPKNWELRCHARRIRLRSHARPMGSTESRPHLGVAAAADQPLYGREPDGAWTGCDQRRCASDHADRPQGAGKGLVTAVAGCGGVTGRVGLKNFGLAAGRVQRMS